MSTPLPVSHSERLANARRIVIKIGSALFVDQRSGALDRPWLEGVCADVAELRRADKDVVIVSSGAVALGTRELKLDPRRARLEDSQAAAAAGQIVLAHAYQEVLRGFGITAAQVLLTIDDSESRRRYLNARSTLTTLLGLRVIPVINENDTVTTDEIRLGDNDTLGALVTNLVEADALVLLTDQQGLFTADPRRHAQATLVREACAGDPSLEAMAGSAGSALGRGGMLTKVLAAKRAARSGASTIIASGREPDVLTRLAEGEPIGTLLTAEKGSLAARKQWLADHVRLAGRVVLDEGAVRALVKDGKSLLPIGVVDVIGTFGRGEVVGCMAPDGREIARGLVNYGSQEAARIARHPSSEIEGVLGYIDEPELIHRDNLVLL